MISISGHAEGICEAIDGASIVAEDGTFLGRVRNAYASDSILNEYGRFGSEYSRTSIWNEYGRYGSEYSRQSPFNPYTSTPPMILKSDTIIGYLTVNKSINGAVNPYLLKACEF
ncbi:MAG: hypothetical protein CL908_09040 [Deltaproteobacteria bacterium]|nr:hypothetical protein [Deltaproteobacteria bacterium]